MIVISGALVLVALVLLVIGLVGPSLGFVYASIGASLAAFLFLVVGILQRRKEPVAVTGAPVSAEELAAAIRTPETHPVTAEELADAASTATVAAPVAGSVLVVPGRPRYHVAGCRYLTGKTPEELPVTTAQEDGYTACGVCKPDEALLAAAPVTVEEAGLDETVEELVEDVAPVTVRAAKAPAKAARAATKTVSAKAVAAKPVTTKAVAAKAVTTKAVATKAVTTKTAAATATKAAPAKRGGVVVIPNRDKFHTPTCRFVRGVEGAEELTKAVATRRGYQPCGVCNP